MVGVFLCLLFSVNNTSNPLFKHKLANFFANFDEKNSIANIRPNPLTSLILLFVLNFLSSLRK